MCSVLSALYQRTDPEQQKKAGSTSEETALVLGEKITRWRRWCLAGLGALGLVCDDGWWLIRLGSPGIVGL